MDATSYMLGKKNGGTTPTGTISITENGEHDVTNYATANVNVEPDLESKSVTITENTTTTITPTQDKDGLSSVSVTTNVSASVESIDDLNNVIDAFKIKLNAIPTNYETYTNNAITLYTPNANYSIYIIYRKTYNTYAIAWATGNNPQTAGIMRSGDTIASCDFVVSGTASFTKRNTRYYSTNTYASVEECIQAIQNSTTSYTSSSSDSKYSFYDANSVYATNRYYVDYTTNDFITTKRISQNETIQTI